MKNLLSGKIALIMGASSGIGKEIAKKFALEGADLILCARNFEKLKNTEIEIKKNISSIQRVHSFSVDVSEANQVKKLLQFTLEHFTNCDIIVNSSGIYGPKGLIEENKPEDWKKSIEINLLGPMLLFHYFIPIFKKQNHGKIIQLSGGGATNPMPYLSSYAASKAGVVRLIETLSKELKAYNIYANAVAPGPLNTEMLDEIINAGPDKVGKEFFNKSLMQKQMNDNSFDNITNLSLFLASSKSDGISGKLISALWDDWEKWPSNLSELNESDLYTIRRIIGKDRSSLWGDK